MPKFDGNHGIDGLLYSDPVWPDHSRYLPVRHATFLDALRHFGWETARLPRLQRPLMAQAPGHFVDSVRWVPLGDRVSLSGNLAFQGSMIRPASFYRRWYAVPAD
jgi:hypothetical protein